MKKSILLSAIMFVFAFTINAQNDTMYVMKAGLSEGKYNVNEQVDSGIFYKPQTQAENTFTDARDGNVYKIIIIGNQVWMAENRKYLPSVFNSAPGSKTTPHYYVYGYNGRVVADAIATENYNIYGVLYNWLAAMIGSTSNATNPSGVQGVYPTGWYLPGDTEWAELIGYLGGTNAAGGKLKETGTTH